MSLCQIQYNVIKSVIFIIYEQGETARAGVFASGDVVLGAKTVVEAVRDSKRVADAMDAYMRAQANGPCV